VSELFSIVSLISVAIVGNYMKLMKTNSVVNVDSQSYNHISVNNN